MADIVTMLLAAIAHQRAARPAEAEALYQSVLAVDPGHGHALYLYGLLQLETNRAHDAAATLHAAAIARPGHAGTFANLGRALLADRRPVEALAVADRLLRLEPNHAEAAFLRGTALNALGEPALAVVSFERTLALDPGNAAALLNLGNACTDLDRLDDAERYCRAATRLAPDLVEAHASLGFVLTSLGRPDAAIAACETAIALRADFALAHWNQAVAALLAGDFELGFREYEWRKRHDRFRRDFVDLPGPQWDGGDPNGRTILVHAEQGLGDTIQFARYLPLIAERGGHPVLACERPLIPLLAGMPGVTVVPKDASPRRYDCWIDQMSLPRVFATRLDTIPALEGYLHADPARIAAWRATLPGGLNVGLAWAGNPAHSNDRRRSLPASALDRILAVPEVHFVNLQVGSRANEIGLADMSPWLIDYAETAALIGALDLVVSVDTSVVHVAGALAKPAWVLLPYAPDWRWLLGRNDTPWYASLRLFRQPAPGDWDSAVTAAAESLGCLTAARQQRPVGRE
jgi:tetratricopeptide (TPR) repeat protein